MRPAYRAEGVRFKSRGVYFLLTDFLLRVFVAFLASTAKAEL